MYSALYILAKALTMKLPLLDLTMSVLFHDELMMTYGEY